MAQGAMYQFDEPSGGWASETNSHQFALSASDQYAVLGYSTAVGISGSDTLVFAGAPGYSSNNGAAFVFKR